MNSITGFETYEKKGFKYEVMVSGERTELGISASKIEHITIFDPNGEDVTEKFELKFVEGKIHVYIDILNFESQEISKTYDMKDLPDGYKINGDIPDNYRVEIISTAKKTVGKHLNSFSVRIYNESGEDVTDHYRINKLYGSLIINPRQISIIAGSAQKRFDGTSLSTTDYSVVGELSEGHSIKSCTIVGSQTSIGKSKSIVTDVVIVDENGNVVTQNYEIELIPGNLLVTSR
jgi:uncharacterized protein YnzC (UPF0291/DUF896 family)